MTKMTRKFKLLISLLIITALFLSACAPFYYELPEPEIPVTSTIYDANGNKIHTIFEENRIEIDIENVSPEFLKALVASEDHRFFQHRGFNLQAIARAAIRNIRAGRTVEGGSTITQQTAKNLFLTPERTLTRKLEELFLTFQLERTFTKREILEMYINLIYFGHGAYGIEVAAQTYFGKSAADLTLGEGAVLVGLLPGPAFYSPFTRPEAARERQAIVLNRMVELDLISEEEAEAAKTEPFDLAERGRATRNASYIIQEVISEITEKYEDGANLLYRGGLSIHTSINLHMQQSAERALAQGLENHDENLQGALVAIEPATGMVRAMVGGRDFVQSPLNRAVVARRQPGSAFKPFLYAAAIDQGYTAGDTILWEPVSFELPQGRVWEPTEYGNREYPDQDFTLKESLAISSNVISAKLVDEISPRVLASYANRMGIESRLGEENLSLALGTSEVTPFELTSAYGTLANGGVRAEPIIITKIVDRHGRVLEENRPQLNHVLDRQVAYIVTDMMRAVLQPGGTAARVANVINRPAAGKTGTTDNYRDAWFVGYTPEIVAGVYVGFDDPRNPVGGTGGGVAAPIWANFIAAALADEPVRDFDRPNGIITKTICADSGLLAAPNSPKTLEASFIIGTEPREQCDLHARPDRDETERRNFFDWFFDW